MTDKIVRATVTGDLPAFINGVLHLPGEQAAVNLATLGVVSLDDASTPNLSKVSLTAVEAVAMVPIAAVAPHAPGAVAPQGIPTGTLTSGTGRLMTTDGDGAAEYVAAGVEATAATPHVPQDAPKSKPVDPKPATSRANKADA